MIVSKILTITLLCTSWSSVHSARILGIFPMAATSHYNLGNALMKGLAEAGHNVTMISPFEDKDPPKKGSYRDIVLTGFKEEFDKLLKLVNLLETKNQSMLQGMLDMFTIIEKLNVDFYVHENVQTFLKSEEKFDVVIVEQFLIDGMKIFGHIFNAPVIVLSALGANPWVNDMMGNPSPLSYIPVMESAASPYMTFTERIGNLFGYLMNQAMDDFLLFPLQNRILKRYFPNSPDISDLFYNVSLVLLNSHESLNQAVPSVPNMIQIGGFHVKPPKKLPKDLQEYLDNAKEGVVYFSMGSNLKSKDLPPYKRDAFLTAFSKLKQKVLWKWEEEHLPGKPPNVKVEKWLPQQDILAHPNVKLFITHSGLLSTIETVYHGVPILGIPVFGDQHVNAKLATLNGFALSLPYEDPSFSEEKLSEMLQELLTNPQYRDNVKKRCQIFHDRPMKPMDTAVYWVEYVIRNGGAPHLKVAGIRFSWFKYHSLDVVTFLVVVIIISNYVGYLVFKKVWSWWRNSKKSKSKSKRE